MHPIYSAAVVVFGALILGVAYYVSSRDSHRPHSYQQERPTHRSGPGSWNWRDNNNLGDGVRCGICLDTEDGPTKRLRCAHEFHEDCISQWFRSNNGIRTCPLCRVH